MESFQIQNGCFHSRAWGTPGQDLADTLELLDRGARMVKRSEYQKAKATAWRHFSKYIRARDCLQMTGDLKVGKCIVCGRDVRFEKADAGHFSPGRGDASIFEETNCHLECIGCNRFKESWIPYEIEMLKRYGFDETQRLKMLYFSKFRYSVEELREKATEYRLRFKELCNVKAL